MNEELSKVYDESIDFWNKAQVFSEDDFAGPIDQDKDWREIGSAGMFKLITASTAGWKNVLDYGCGTGWLDVILAKTGVTGIKSVDVAKNAVESAKLYAEVFECADKVDHEAVDVEWLGHVDKDTFDYAVCCNVLDVVPTEVSEGIIKNLALSCKKGGKVLISLNPFFTDEMLSRGGMEYRKPYVFVNGILRVNNHTDEEWKEMFSPFFEVEKLDYFKWDVEAEEHRRFFTLKVK